MAKTGFENVAWMRGRRKGGKPAAPNPPAPGEGTVADCAAGWLAHMAERAYSPRSIETHRAAIGPFLAWCRIHGIARPEDIARPDLERYQSWLYRYRKGDGNPLGVATRRNRLGAIQRLFKWLVRRGRLPANPASDLDLPRKQPAPLPKALGYGEIRRLLAIPDPSDPLGLRDRTILQVLYSCGLRRAEVTGLDIGDIDLETGVARVRHGKGGRGRTVPLGGRALLWVKKYLASGRPRLSLGEAEQALFISGYGTRISSAYLGNWVSRTIRAAGIKRGGSCHLLRHSCATHMLEGGADIRVIAQLLGHARLETTQIYTAVTITHLREVHARTHPHGKG